MNLQDILEELVKKYIPYDGVYSIDDIAQAKSKIEELFGEWVGSNWSEVDKGLKKDWNRGFIDGYNTRGEEIRKRVKEEGK